jgi:hypothetical protein
MGRIKYQEAIGLEVKRGRPSVAPRQLVLDYGNTLNEFYNLTKKRT